MFLGNSVRQKNCVISRLERVILKIKLRMDAIHFMFVQTYRHIATSTFMIVRR